MMERSNTYFMPDLSRRKTDLRPEIYVRYEWENHAPDGETVLVVVARVVAPHRLPTLRQITEIESLGCAICWVWSINSSETSTG